MKISRTKFNLLLQYFERSTKKSKNLEKFVASESKRVRYSMLQELLGKINGVLPQSSVEPECLTKKFKALSVKKRNRINFNTTKE